MTVTVGPNLGLLINALAGEEHVEAYAKFLRGIDGLLPRFVSSIETAPPGGESDGDLFLVAASGASGAFTGHANKIARYYAIGDTAPGWEFYTPKNGWFVYVIDDDVLYVMKSAAWARYQPKKSSSTSDPDTSFDDTQGYAVFSTHVNTSSGNVFFCTSAATGAAGWVDMSLTIAELGTMAVQDADDVAITGGLISGTDLNRQVNDNELIALCGGW